MTVTEEDSGLHTPESSEAFDDDPALIDPAAPTEHQRAGGAPRGFAWLLVVAAVVGTLASAMLTLDYIRVLQDPSYVPACDINPLVGCGQFLGSEQSWAFGFPNVIIGLVAFPILLATGAAMLAGARLARWHWRGLVAGAVFGIAFVGWLQWQSLTVIRGLCPYCLVVWSVVIPVFVHTIARAVQGGHLPAAPGLRRALVANRWVIVAIWFIAVVAVIGLAFSDEWASML